MLASTSPLQNNRSSCSTSAQEARWRADFEVRPSVLTWIKVFRKRHRANFPFAQDAAAPFLITFFDKWWYEDSGTDESGDFLRTRLPFKVNRLGTTSASSLEPLRDKRVTFAHEMYRQAPSGLSFVMVSHTWTRLFLEEMVVGSPALVLAFSVDVTFVSVVLFTREFYDPVHLHALRSYDFLC